ncbi:SDR family oxidoreductase [Lentilactobacillus buchneri]|uniref:SDR family oxidoreductase n=1 Tax=Lentilactobacillus buchneri TaxID=1581 RepID=UPI0034E5795A
MAQSQEEIKHNAESLNQFKMDWYSLKGKVAIITGGNTGLGQGYAVAMAEAGADVFIPTFGQEGWDTTRELVEARGRKVEFMDVDLTEKGIAINLSAVYHLSLAASKEFAKQKSGKIINIGSMLSFQGGKFIPSYTAAKHGVAGLTKAFASEMAAYNVQVNAIAPGYIKTANTAPIRADKSRNDEILGRIAAGHWGEPYELMGISVYLASNAANYINGAIIPVDGGYLVR